MREVQSKSAGVFDIVFCRIDHFLSVQWFSALEEGRLKLWEKAGPLCPIRIINLFINTLTLLVYMAQSALKTSHYHPSTLVAMSILKAVCS